MPRLLRPGPKIPAITHASTNRGNACGRAECGSAETDVAESGLAESGRAVKSGIAVMWSGGRLARPARSAFAGRCDGVFEFGPVVVIVSVTAVMPAPAAIEAGLNPQLVNVNAGGTAHAKLTPDVNVAPPTGAAENA